MLRPLTVRYVAGPPSDTGRNVTAQSAISPTKVSTLATRQAQRSARRRRDSGGASRTGSVETGAGEAGSTSSSHGNGSLGNGRNGYAGGFTTSGVLRQ